MALETRAQQILDFWNEIGPEGWYSGESEIDTAIRGQFLTDWENARAGAHTNWLGSAQGQLAFLILTDQFPRNMFRGDGRSFATDPMALSAAKRACWAKSDLTVEGDLRQFYYMPFMHSETLVEQYRCVAQFTAHLAGDGPNSGNLLHARAHREIIRIYGRFPYRNAALKRQSSAAEQAFIEGEGYSGVLRALQN